MFKKDGTLLVTLSLTIILIIIVGFFALQQNNFKIENTKLRTSYYNVKNQILVKQQILEEYIDKPSMDMGSNKFINGWKIYKNDEHGISFKYPSIFSESIIYDNPSDGSTKNIFYLAIDFKNKDEVDSNLNGLRFLDLNIINKNINEWLMEEVYVGRFENSTNPKPNDFKKRADFMGYNEVELSGKKAFRYDEENCDITGCSKNKNIILVVEENNKLYEFKVGWLFRDFADLFFESLSVTD